MGKLKVLLTIDLPDLSNLPEKVAEKMRGDFYKSLAKAKWVKMSDITTVWRKTFEENTSSYDVRANITNSLQKAKRDSDAKEVSYYFLISDIDVESGKI